MDLYGHDPVTELVGNHSVAYGHKQLDTALHGNTEAYMTPQIHDLDHRPRIESPWMDVAEAALYAKRHPETIRDALRAGELKGSRTGETRGKWSIHRNHLDAWIAGEKAEVIIPSVTRRRAS